MPEIKVERNTKEHITNSYLKAFSGADEQVDYKLNKVLISNDEDHEGVPTHWLANYIQGRAKIILTNMGGLTTLEVVEDTLKEEFATRLLNKVKTLVEDSKQTKQSMVKLSDVAVYDTLISDARLMKGYVKESAKYTQKILYSDIKKEGDLKQGLGFIIDNNNYQSITTITIDSAKRANAEALLSQQINRKDQLAFIQKVLEVGKDATKAELGLSERDFNKKFERSLKTIAKYQSKNKEEFEYLQALVNELVMTDVSDVELTLDDEIEEVYNEAVRA